MGLFGSKSSKKTYQTTTQTTTTAGVQGGGLAVSGEGNVVSVSETDAGAVAGAFDFASDAVEASRRTSADALGFAEGIYGQSTDTVLEALGGYENVFRGALGFAERQSAAYQQSLADNVGAALSGFAELSLDRAQGEQGLLIKFAMIAGVAAVAMVWLSKR